MFRAMAQGQRSDELIVALDFTALGPALRMARRLRDLVRIVKVGNVLFTACGPTVIQRLRAMGLEVMLDLKFFDIPSTVGMSCRLAVSHRVSMLTVHACGPSQMLEAAVAGARDEAKRLRVDPPLVLGVTVLTSEPDRSGDAVRRRVVRLACAALEAGCDGIVASAREAPWLRKRLGDRCHIVCPGIRPSSFGRSDQRRVATPSQALKGGANRIIVGRPIIAAPNPRLVTQRIVREMEDASGC